LKIVLCLRKSSLFILVNLGTWQAIYKMDLDGNLIQKYTFSTIQSSAEVDSFHITENGEVINIQYTQL
jgi:hypothetical protein